MAEPAAVFPRRGRFPLLRTALGEVLRRIRREQGRTLGDVARAAKVSLPYLSELERGRKEASSEVLAALCDALGIGLTMLLAEACRELARRDLAGGQRRQGTVIRLGSQPPGARALPARPGPGDPVCLLAA
jgi:XRE family transcriptional regulator, stress-response regulator